MRPRGDHFYTADAAKRDHLVAASGYVAEGIECWTPAPGSATTPLYQLYHPGAGDHLYVISAAGRDQAVAQLGFVDEGVACHVFANPQADTTPLYRLYHPVWQDHFYVISAAGRDQVVADLGYIDEGVECHVYASDGPGRSPLFRAHKMYGAVVRLQPIIVQSYADEGIACHVLPAAQAATTPLYRLYHPVAGDHFYLISAAGRDQVIADLGFLDEGIECHVFASPQPGTTPLYRLFHPGSKDHFYTTSASERDFAVTAAGYIDEGVECHVYPSPVPGSVPLYRLYLHPRDHLYVTSAAGRDQVVINGGPNVGIDTSVTAMREVFDTAGIKVEVADVRRWSMHDQVDLDLGPQSTACKDEKDLTAEQQHLYSQRDGMGELDVAVYFVRSLIPVFNGCATHPAGKPGAAIAAAATRWTLAHEVGHVLGLGHVTDADRLMFSGGTGNITNPPPDLTPDEITAMDASPYTTDI